MATRHADARAASYQPPLLNGRPILMMARPRLGWVLAEQDMSAAAMVQSMPLRMAGLRQGCERRRGAIAERSAIEWRTGTWNPTTGCDRISAGCDNRYALALARRLKPMGQPKYQNEATPGRPFTRLSWQKEDEMAEPAKDATKAYGRSHDKLSHLVAERGLTELLARPRCAEWNVAQVSSGRSGTPPTRAVSPSRASTTKSTAPLEGRSRHTTSASGFPREGPAGVASSRRRPMRGSPAAPGCRT